MLQTALAKTAGTPPTPDPWAVTFQNQAGFLGDAFLRAQAERDLLDTWMGTDWHKTAYELGASPDNCLPGIQALAAYIAGSFIGHLANAPWLDVDEAWEDSLRRERGILKAGVNQKNLRVNLAEELHSRFNRWRIWMDAEDAPLQGAGFRLGCLNPFRGMLSQAQLQVVDGHTVQEALQAQQLVEIWHECLGRVHESWDPKEDATSIGIRVGIIHVFRQVAPKLAPQKAHLERSAFRTWMLDEMHQEYVGRYVELVGHRPDGRRHLALLQKPLAIGPLASLTKGKGRAPSTPEQDLSEAFMGLKIQVLHPAENSYFFLGPGLLTPLLYGLAFTWWKDTSPTRILQIRHGRPDLEHDSIAILLPSVAAFNVGLGGWLVLPFYWSGRGSIGPSRLMHVEQILQQFPDRFEWRTLDVSFEEFRSFLQKQSTGRPDWLSQESLRAQALGWERAQLLPKAQSLVLELLTERYAWQILQCTAVRPTFPIGDLECDIVGETETELYHFECQNSIPMKRAQELVDEFRRKCEALKPKADGRAIVQYFVTRQAAIDARGARAWVEELAASGIRVLAFEKDLLPLFPKQYGRDRLSSIFPGSLEDPVLKIEQMLARLEEE